MFISYNESILAYIASIRKYLGLSSSYEPDRQFSELLDRKRPEKIFLLLIDAMGANLLERKLPEDAFLRRNMYARVQTVFPSTTTAATTSIRNGRAPNENAWLGWTQYLKEVDDIIVPFWSKGYYNDISYEKDMMEKIIPVLSTEEELKQKGISARRLYPAFEEDGCDDFDQMCNRLVEYSHDSDYRYIYAYWDKYDTYMHEHGVDSKICDSYLLHINYEIEKLAENLSDDTLLFVTADHGQVDIRRFYNFFNSPYEKFLAMRPSLESRAQAFFIKKGMEEEFEKMFKAEFEKDYVLLSRDQVLRSKLFGEKKNHPRFEEFIGDYLAIAKSDLAFIYHERERKKFAGQHAGMTDDEVMIPIIINQAKEHI